MKRKNMLKNTPLAYAEIGHDLRQPLQAIKILLSLLKEDVSSLSQFELLTRIENAVIYLESGVENLLATAKLQESQLKAHYAKVDLAQMLRTIAEEYRIIAVYKKLNLTYGGKNVIIKTDAVLLERIIRNLLHNALKFSRGKINVHWYALPNKVRIIIKDNGYGLKKEECEHLFEAYYQCPKDRKQGCGLGLAIVKELAQVLNINLNLKSKWKKGTVFILTLSQ